MSLYAENNEKRARRPFVRYQSRLELVNQTQSYDVISVDASVTSELVVVAGRNYDDEDILKYVDVGATYYFNKNMSTYVDYKINLLDDNQFTRDAGINTDNIVALGLVYQF